MRWLGLALLLGIGLALVRCGDGEPSREAEPAQPPAHSPTPSGVSPSLSPETSIPASATQEPVPAPLEPMRVTQAFPNISYPRMVHLTYADDDTNRLFLVLQPGQIIVFPNKEETTSSTIFLDIRERVSDAGNEEGLLGLAFDPEYRTNGFFYVYYSASSPRRSILSRFSMSRDDPNRANPASELILLEVSQPFPNHNGGNLVFGPEGYLYVGLGDGGFRGDPRDNGQNRRTLLGSILRIDVSATRLGQPYTIPPDNPFVGLGNGVREEIWAYGLRNPWRFTFDRATGQLWAGDVGQNDYEEVDIIRPGLNYGWDIMEGLHCYPPSIEACDQQGLEPPIIEYSQAEGGCSITGGYVYRGSRLPSLYGAYIYGDFCSGKVWALRYNGAQVTEHAELVDSRLQISAFGEGQDGEVYILSFDRKIYRLEPVG